MSDRPTASSLQQAVESRLQSYARFGVDLGLDRVRAVLDALDNPQRRVPIIHVAGTNGKGSVCAYLASVLTAAGYKTGRYTSPHLVDWRERICIDGEPISWIELQAALDQVEAAIAHQKSNVEVTDASALETLTPTQFEVFTAAACQYFAQQQVDVAVIEVGLGGRLDATNVWERPLATVIVSIGRDHWQRLGDTLAKIAGEKAGILKSEVPAIVGPLPAEAATVVEAKATTVGAPLVWVEPAQKSSQTSGEDLLSYGGVEYLQTLLGEHQRINSACAIAVLQSLQTQGWAISNAAIIEGMSQVRWPGRLQQVQWQGHSLLIDGAHNQAAARSLRTYLDRTYPTQPITWLIGMLQTKDHADIFEVLLRPGDRLHLTQVPEHMSADPAALSAIAQQICPELAEIQTYRDLQTVLSAAIQTQPVVFCGSLYLIGHFFSTLYSSDSGTLESE